MTPDVSQKELEKALEQLTYALELLDAASAPPQIGAYVDLAIQQLYSAFAKNSAGSALSQIKWNTGLQ